MKRKSSHNLGSETPAKLKKESTSRTVGQMLTSLKKEKSVAKPPLQPAKWPSFSQRQRKAPSWLVSYVTNSTQEKEVKNEKSKPKLPRFPTLIPPSKQKKEIENDAKKSKVPHSQSVTQQNKQKKEADGGAAKLKVSKSSTVAASSKEKEASNKKTNGTKSEEMPSLRRQSTLKLQSPPTSPEPVLSNKRAKNDLKSRASLVRKSTEISNPTDESSDENVEKKPVNSTTGKKISVLSKNSNNVKLSSQASETKSKARKTDSALVFKKYQVNEVNSSQNCTTNVVEICDNKHFPDDKSKLGGLSTTMVKPKPTPSIHPKLQNAFNMQNANTILLPEPPSRPNMLEVVICISTSGALRDYLSVLQTRVREMIWRLQSLVPNLRIGVLAHTQGGIHDDQTRVSCGSGDHNYNRVGGHSGTKWLDLGATLSQICAFVDSLEPEPTVYPDYVQDNLEMALWKLQRCMSWSSCSYRTVIMIGRGRPNRTSFYLQKEHWRSWIRSALELKSYADIPVIDWELEAKLLAEMGIHVFTIQGSNGSTKPEAEDEGTIFFSRVAELTQGQHVRITDPSRLVEIILGICCACHGPDLLLDHRDTVRDDNDGVLPSQLTEVFVSLQLHSKSCSLASLPSMLGNLDIAGMRQRLTNSQETIMECSDEEEDMEAEEVRHSLPMDVSETIEPATPKPKAKERGTAARKMKGQGVGKNHDRGKPYNVKGKANVKKNLAVNNNRTNKKIKQAVKAVTTGKAAHNSAKKTVGRKKKEAAVRDKPYSRRPVGRPRKDTGNSPLRRPEKSVLSKRKANNFSHQSKKLKSPASSSKREANGRRPTGKGPDKNIKNNPVLKARAALKLKAAKTKLVTANKRGRPRSAPQGNTNSPRRGKPNPSSAKNKKSHSPKTPRKNDQTKTKKTVRQQNERKSVLVRKNSRTPTAKAKKDVKALTKGKFGRRR